MNNNFMKFVAAAFCTCGAVDLVLWYEFVAAPLALKIGGGVSTTVLLMACGAAFAGMVGLSAFLAVKYKFAWKTAQAQAEK